MHNAGHKFSAEVNFLIDKGYDVYRIQPGNMKHNFRAAPGQKGVDPRPVPDALLKLQKGFEMASGQRCCAPPHFHTPRTRQILHGHTQFDLRAPQTRCLLYTKGSSQQDALTRDSKTSRQSHWVAVR